jgi:hypothetical protein
MNSTISLLFVAVASLTVIPVEAGTVAHWKQLNVTVSPALTGLDTDGPTIGDATANNAQSSWLAGRFGTVASPESVTLAIGQTLEISGRMILTGGTNTANQIRFGIFNDAGQFAAGDGSNWAGGWMHNNGNVASSDLWRGSSTGAFVTTGGNSMDLNAIITRTGLFDGSSVAPFVFRMTITRDSDTTLDIVSQFTGGDGSLDEMYVKDDVPASDFTFTCVGVLLGGTSGVDQAVLSGVQYTVSGDSSVPRILNIERDAVSVPGNLLVTLTFTSSETKTYTVYISDDLSSPVESRVDLTDNLAGATGSNTTVYAIDYNAFSIPIDAPQKFFVIKENG